MLREEIAISQRRSDKRQLGQGLAQKELNGANRESIDLDGVIEERWDCPRKVAAEGEKSRDHCLEVWVLFGSSKCDNFPL